jgi:hypothetical protein
MPRKPRVVIPENPGELFKLASQVYQQHQALGNKSPLLVLDEPTWPTVGPSVAQAQQLQADIEELERRLKELYGARTPYLAQFTDIARRSRDLLLAKHATNPAALGAYGFDVIEAPAAAPKGQL